MKFIVFIVVIALGFALIRFSKWLVDSTGIRFLTIERFLGPGGTYTFWKFLGLALIVGSFWYLFH